MIEHDLVRKMGNVILHSLLSLGRKRNHPILSACPRSPACLQPP